MDRKLPLGCVSCGELHGILGGNDAVSFKITHMMPEIAKSIPTFIPNYYIGCRLPFGRNRRKTRHDVSHASNGNTTRGGQTTVELLSKVELLSTGRNYAKHFGLCFIRGIGEISMSKKCNWLQICNDFEFSD